MAFMKKEIVFFNSGIGITVWIGNAGDKKIVYYKEQYERINMPFILGSVRGRCKRYMENDPSNFEMFNPGDTSEKFGEQLLGNLIHDVLDDNTLHICPGAVNEYCQAVWQPIGKIVHEESFTLETGRVAVLIFGFASSTTRYTAPHIFYAKSNDIDIDIESGIIMEIWRK